MAEEKKHILVLEPYYGGSHKSFLDGLEAHLPYDFTLLTLPARKWKMRMQLAAPWMAEQVIRLIRAGQRFDALLCSSFVDAATVRALLSMEEIRLPLLVYFHENQFAYPSQVKDCGMHQFTALNFTSALAADGIAFNSRYNRDTFLAGVRVYLKKSADMDVRHLVKEMRGKSTVLHPGIEICPVEDEQLADRHGIPVIVWNHRWEHDKDPHAFFQALFALSAAGVEFKLIVVGQHFERCPAVFAEGRQLLKRHIIHFGFVEDKMQYWKLLKQGDIVVSTARHEFFGIAVLEAVSCGCFPLVPDRLSYRELFPPSYRYKNGLFRQALQSRIEQGAAVNRQDIISLSAPYTWPNLAADYGCWFSALSRN